MGRARTEAVSGVTLELEGLRQHGDVRVNAVKGVRELLALHVVKAHP